MPYTNAVSHWFDRHRGLAISVMMLGMGVGAIVIPSVSQRLVATLGWRHAYTVFGFAVLLIPVPTRKFIRAKPIALSPTLTTGPQFFGKLLILRPRLQKVFTTVSPPYATVSARWATILGDGWDGNCRCNWWSSIW